MKKTFDEWFAAVDAACRSKYGVSIHDLPDCCYRDWYEARVTPKGAASRAWKLAQE